MLSDAAVRSHCHEEAQERFDLSTGPLVRGRLLKIAAEQHVLLVTMHHIVSDGWSMGVLCASSTPSMPRSSKGATDPPAAAR